MIARRLSRPARRPEAWAYLLLSVVAFVALGNGTVLVAGAAGVGPESAAGWFVGVAGLALAILVALAMRQDRRFTAQSLVTSIANVIVAEEEEAGRDVEERFQTELPPLPPREVARALILSAALITAWMVLLPWLGFGLVTAIVCFSHITLIGKRKWWVALMAGSLIGGSLAILFSLVGVLVPSGALWHLFS